MTSTSARTRLGGIASSLGAVLGFLLLPKCPLCVAALLGAAGVGAGAASLMAPLLRPVAVLLAIVALARVAWSARRARLASAGAGDGSPCCGGGGSGARRRWFPSCRTAAR